MKSLERNKTKFYYCLYKGKREFKDENGDYTGEYVLEYGEPIECFANISASVGSAQSEQFGNFEGYDKVISASDINIPIDENTVLFIEKDPEFDKDGNPLYNYIVKKVAKSLNAVSYAVTKVVVS